MPTIGLLCGDEADRQALTLLAGEAGYLVCAASRVQEAVEVLRERRPKAMLVVESAEGEDAEAAVRDVLRVSPLLPVVVALKRRDAARAVALMRAGAAEVIAPPWTRENVRACLSKTLRFQGTAFSVVKATRSRSPHFYFFAVLVFFAAALGTLSVRRAARSKAEAEERVYSWDLPYKHPSALAFDGRSLWVADWFTQSLYRHSPSEGLGLEGVVHFPADTPVALAFTPEAAWTVSASGQIVRRQRDAQLTPLQRYSAPGTTSLAYDGLYLWTYDARSKRLIKRLLDSELSEAGVYRYPGAQCAALTFDGKTLWSLDAVHRELIRHNLERPDEALERVPLPEYSAGGYRPVGLSYDGQRFWTVAEKLPSDSGPARIFQHAPRPR